MNLHQRIKKAEQQIGRTKSVCATHIIKVAPDENRAEKERKYHATHDVNDEDLLIWMNFIRPEQKAEEA